MFRAEHPRRDAANSATPVVWHADEAPPVRAVPAGVLAAAAGFVAMWPFTSVIQPGSWSVAVVTVIVAVAVVGMAMRALLRHRGEGLRDTATLLAQLVVAVAVVTQTVGGDTAFFGILPTPTTISIFGALAASAWQEVAFGAAPLEASSGLAATMGLGFAIVAVLLDQLVAHRAAVLPALLTGVVGSVPMIVTLGDANVVWFVMLAVIALLLFRFAARRNPSSPRRSSATITAGIAVAAVASTLAIAPGLPLAAGISGTGAGISVDASLRLGDDLRQPNPVEVLRVATEADAAPYLRLTTLSDFDGRVWQPDRGDLQSQADGFGDPEWGADIETTEATTSVEVLRMSSAWLPLPYPATAIEGLPRAWRVMPDNRTLVSRNTDAEGADYTVSSLRVRPTLEQIRAVDAAPPEEDSSDEPVDIPAIVGDLAREVTADESTDYDRLVALQTWFRNEFTYSLDTPVEEGFDGTGAQAVAQFLNVRSGYCVHFAGAFSLMAESLGMETRIVVGYLPGSPTQEKQGDAAVYSVTSDRLHSWPEVLFPGIGWVPFEPTASLGVPTGFRAADIAGGGTTGSTTPTETTAPQSEQSSAPEVERPDAGDNSGTTGQLREVDSTPILLVVLAAILVVLLPALIRRVVRTRRIGRARAGDAGAAWAEVRATLVDLGLSVSDADTPRERAATLIRERSVDREAMALLTAAIERSSYARPGADAADLGDALRSVLRALTASADRPARLRAVLVPRSLFVARGADAAAAA